MSYTRYPSGGGGAAVWGSITGSLSAQTDLQTALNAKLNIPSTQTDRAILTSNNAGGTRNNTITIDSTGDIHGNRDGFAIFSDGTGNPSIILNNSIGFRFNTNNPLWSWDGGAQYALYPDTQIIFGQAGTTGSFLIKGNDNNTFNDAVNGTMRAGNGAGSRTGGSLTLQGGSSSSGTGGDLTLAPGDSTSGTQGNLVLNKIKTLAAASDAMTMTNGPTGTAGNPTKFIRIVVDGSPYVIPLWPG